MIHGTIHPNPYPTMNEIGERIVRKQSEQMTSVPGGTKYDSGKDRWDLLPLECIQQIVKVMTFGANKYADNGWKAVDTERYVAALFRHIAAWRAGETHDQESGLHHLAHAATNVVFLLWFELRAIK